MKKLILTGIGTLIYLALEAFPCTKYVIDFDGKAMQGKFKIGWSVNTGFNRCDFPPDEISKHRFIVTMESLQDGVFLRDTVDQNYFVINTFLTGNTPFVFGAWELGSSDHTKFILVRPEEQQMPQLSSTIDTLNFYLLNGYFYNAVYVLDKVERPGLLDDIKKEYKILFPEHYPDEQTYFNSYLDAKSMMLIRMPVVNGLSEFIMSINKLTKTEARRDMGFKIFAKVSDDGRMLDYEVIPGADKQLVDKAIHQLHSSNVQSPMNQVVIIIARSKNRKKFVLVNGRALMDQHSKYFKTRFPYMGPIY